MLRFYLINPMRAKFGKKGNGIFVPGSLLNECGQKINKALPIIRSRATYFSLFHSRASKLAGLLSPSMKNWSFSRWKVASRRSSKGLPPDRDSQADGVDQNLYSC